MRLTGRPDRPIAYPRMGDSDWARRGQHFAFVTMLCRILTFTAS